MNFIHRYEPASSWVSEINRLIDRSLTETTRHSAPHEAFHESDTSWILRIDLPGFSKPDVKLTVTDQILHLTAETGSEQFFVGKFDRKWNLGDDVDITAISARLENGVLELTLPKRIPVIPQPTTIEIN
ncbi:MAG: Hsp20/alpha crystallin family protein [Luteolibacter sp.]